jgi:hypothetical protein
MRWIVLCMWLVSCGGQTWPPHEDDETDAGSEFEEDDPVEVPVGDPAPDPKEAAPGSCEPGAACSDAIWHCSDFCYSAECCLISCTCEDGSYSCSISC